MCPFILLGDTARGVIEREKIEGKEIYTGVRKNDYTESVQSMLRTLASNVDVRLGIEDYQKNEDSFTWKFKGVPIIVKLIKEKYGFFENPDHKWFFWDNFRIPNPFNEYWKVRDQIQ